MTGIAAVLALLAFAAGSGAPAEDLHRLFMEANRLFDGARSEKDLRDAEALYRTIIDRGVRNGMIYYDLGYTQFRLREIGPAVLNLRRALLYLPQDGRATATLAVARGKVTDEFARKDEAPALRTLLFWHYGTTFPARLWTGILTSGVFWTLLALRSFVRLPFHRTALVALFAVAAVSLTSVAVEGLGKPGEEGVVTAPEVLVRSGNGADFGPVFKAPIHGGVELRILETRDAWRQVEFPDGSRGWMPSSAVEAVRPGTGFRH